MTTESLRSQVEKRIAELKEEMRTEAFGDELAEYRTGIHELEQVLTLIDEMAKELETGKQNVIDFRVNNNMSVELGDRYWYYTLGLEKALKLFIGNNNKQVDKQ